MLGGVHILFHLVFYFLFFAVVTDAMSFLLIVPHLLSKDLYVISSILLLRNNNSNQYSVSKLSFKAISNLFIKSALLCAYFASCIFAPMDDEERIL